VAVQVPGLAGTVDQVVLAEEVQRIEQEAEQRGYEAGRNRAEAELRAAVDGASALARTLEDIAPERTSEIAHSIAELALSVAKRIIQHEVRIEPSLLCAALEAAVSTINGSPEAHVLLNPAAVEPVEQAWEALHGRAYLGKKWFFEGDPTLPSGGCTLRYEHGFVEAGLEAQLEEVGIALDRAIPTLARGSVEEGVA
jgi:flagellar assembly protein FliH